MTQASITANPIVSRLRTLEEALLDPAVRRNRDPVKELLTEDFVELGASGREWTRDQMLDLLANQTWSPVNIQDFSCTLLAEDVALVTYRAVRAYPHPEQWNAALRSSIWTRKSGKWQMRFHQGTRAASDR